MTIGGDADTWLRDIDTAAYKDCSFTANVDPANDCLGLIADGEMFPVLADSYDVVVAV